MSLEIAELTAERARDAARVHAEAFPGYFLTRLGPRVLEAFYSELAASPAGLGVVGYEDGRAIGFVAGTRSSASFYRGFYRRHAGRVALAVARGIVADPVVRGSVRSRLSHARFLVRRRGGAAAASPGSAVPARILSVAVVPGARGRGAAEALVDAHAARLKAEGIERVGLSVLKANGRARRFYERSGWEIERETEDAAYLVRSTG